MHYKPFLQHVCSYAQTASRESKACKTTTSFYTVLLIELVAAVPKVTDDLVAQILPFVLTGLSKKASVEFQVLLDRIPGFRELGFTVVIVFDMLSGMVPDLRLHSSFG
jgi:hypothetical protein